MRHGRPSKEQLELNFESMLARVLEGHGVRSETGLDSPTRTALTEIARAHPNASEELVQAARRAFAGQLDGSNAEHWRAETDRMLAERAARSRRPQ